MVSSAAGDHHHVTGWRCAVCSAVVDIATDFPWRCPNATATDRHHLLQMVQADTSPASTGISTPDAHFAWAGHAAANGMSLADRMEMVSRLNSAVGAVAGTDFTPTPFARSAELSDALGFTSAGGVWVKDETGGVAGSQKARHLFPILLHLQAVEAFGRLPERPPLAIASCGNAALAAATLARAARWPIEVYVPTWMSDGFGVQLDRLGADVRRCERLREDPPGDPAMLRFREAVEGGAIPFTVQGPENALCLDGGRTIGWEISEQLSSAGIDSVDRVFVQVGGGAFATCLGAGLSLQHPSARLHAVQTAGCAPLVRAWQRAKELDLGPDEVAHHWGQVMTVWEQPQSLADGILDDETYDWIGVFAAMAASGGSPIESPEADVITAHELARSAGFDVSATGSAGLAGLISALRSGASSGDPIGASERVVVVMSGIER